MLDNFWTVTWTNNHELPYSGVYLVASESHSESIGKTMISYLSKYDLKDIPHIYDNIWFNDNFKYFDRGYTQKWSRLNKQFVPGEWKIPDRYDFHQIVVNPYIIILDADGNRVTEESRFNALRYANK